MLGFGSREKEREERRQAVLAEAKRNFRQELLSRLDEILVFQPLGPEEMRQIAGLQVERLCRRAAKQKIDLAVGTEVVEHLGPPGGQPHGGGRGGIRRIVERKLENPLSEYILSGKIKRCRKLRAVLRGDEILLEQRQPAAKAAV